MVEDAQANAGIMSGGDERHARSQAGAEYADAPVALPLQPVDTGPDIDGGLPSGVDGAAHIGRTVVVGAGGFGGLALGMVGHGHAQRADTESVQQLSQTHVTLRIGIPLGQDNQRAATVPGCREPARAHRVVLRVGRVNRAGEAEFAAAEAVVPHRFVGEKAVGVCQRLGNEALQPCRRTAVGIRRATPGIRCCGASRYPNRKAGRRGLCRGWRGHAPTAPSIERKVPS